MWQDPDLWLVMLSLVATAVAIGLWLRGAGDDWLGIDPDEGESMRDDTRTPTAGRRQRR